MGNNCSKETEEGKNPTAQEKQKEEVAKQDKQEVAKQDQDTIKSTSELGGGGRKRRKGGKTKRKGRESAIADILAKVSVPEQEKGAKIL